MNWLDQLQSLQPVAHAILLLSLVAIVGHAVGSLRIKGVSLGVAGVIFAGILFGHLGLEVERTTLEFVREFGLVLFVYTIGMQVGRGFFASLRAQGLPMNLLAAGVILLGGGVAVGAAMIAGIPMPAALGILAGATTNTPALGATQEALKQLPGVTPQILSMPGLGYAVAYPGAIAGLILSLVLLRIVFRVDVDVEREELERKQREAVQPPERMNIVVENTNLEGLRLSELPGLNELQVTVSRMRPVRTSEVIVAREDATVHCGDVLLAVGTQASLERFRLIVGSESLEDLTTVPSSISSRRVVATHRGVVGKTLGDLALRQIYGVTVTRVTRADLEMPAGPQLRIQFGDMLQLVGTEQDVARAAEALGNSARALNQTNLLAIFVGIALGVLVGVLPIHVPWMPVPLRLGLAGGPLIVAILISRVGRLGPIIWHMPLNANLALRELGLTLFLACVGLKSGENFVHTLVAGNGLSWMIAGAAVTLIPVIAGGIVGRLLLRLDFATLCGLLAGSNTDPPALSFATNMNRSEAPTVAYATVYPMTMLLRILVAQFLTVFFVR